MLLNEVNNQFKVDKTYVLNILLYASWSEIAILGAWHQDQLKNYYITSFPPIVFP